MAGAAAGQKILALLLAEAGWVRGICEIALMHLFEVAIRYKMNSRKRRKRRAAP